MRAQFVTVLATLLLAVAVAAVSGAESSLVDPGAVEGVMKTLKGDSTFATPTLKQDASGHVRFLGAVPGTVFDSGSVAKSSAADVVAEEFLGTHADAFGLDGGLNGLANARVRRAGNRTYVRMQQMCGNVPVFGAYVNVQLDSEGQVCSVLSDISTNVSDASTALLTPSVLATKAQDLAISAIAAENPAMSKDVFTATTPELCVYDPYVLGAKGATKLTWQLHVRGSDDEHIVSEMVFVDAHSGAIALHYNDLRSALYREIWDAAYSTGMGRQTRIVRVEGDFPTNDIRNTNSIGVAVADADFAYEYLGDVYNFYFDRFGRDSFDNLGSNLYLQVREPSAPLNAYWSPSGALQWAYTPGIFFGNDMVCDDVVGHEYTHGVTGSEAGLIYFNQSGAIDESLSDIMGEFIDLDNGMARKRSRGTGQHVNWENQLTVDLSTHRWRIAEDSRAGIEEPLIGFRDMATPSRFEDPDRLYSGRFFIGYEDNGGVHWNCGVSNKLCQMLTDGDTFGWAIYPEGAYFYYGEGYHEPSGVVLHGPMGATGEIIWAIDELGLSKVAALFYEAQTNLLVPTSDFMDLGSALVQAAINLAGDDVEPAVRFSYEDVNNVRRGCLAVQLLEGPDLQVNPVRNFRASSIPGERDVVLTWDTSFSMNYQGMRIVRRVGRFPNGPGDGIVLVDNYNDYRYGNSWVDKNLPLGTEYFYAIFAQVYRGDVNSNGYLDTGDIDLQVDYARVTVGADSPDYLSEVFKSKEVDLAFSQILYTPIVDPSVAAESGDAAAYTNYTNYKAGITQPVYELPVEKKDFIRVPMTDDGYVTANLAQSIPFFGNYASSIVLSANGWMAASGIYEVDYLTDPERRDYESFQNIWPTLKNHFELPRIDFLFSDLAPHTAGEVWIRYMNDRMAITFDKVPQHGTSFPNTVQVELFYSGHIRCTYLELNLQDAVIGLSDGKGIPLSPKDVATGQLVPKVLSSDLSDLPDSSTFTLKPIQNFFVSEGDTVQFYAEVDDVSGGTPTIWLESLPDPIRTEHTFTRVTDTKYRFKWVTDDRDGGGYSFKVCAAQGSEYICQYVRIVVADPVNVPEALDVELSWPSGNQDGPLNSEPLLADYTYYQEDNLPEGATEVHWYRNDVEVPWLLNQKLVPAYATETGQKWYFTVLPKATAGSRDPLVGDLAISQMVTIGSDDMPDVNKDGGVSAVDIQMVVNAAIGKTVANGATDVNHSGKTDAVDVQIVVNKALLF